MRLASASTAPFSGRGDGRHDTTDSTARVFPLSPWHSPARRGPEATEPETASVDDTDASRSSPSVPLHLLPESRNRAVTRLRVERPQVSTSAVEGSIEGERGAGCSDGDGEGGREGGWMERWSDGAAPLSPLSGSGGGGDSSGTAGRTSSASLGAVHLLRCSAASPSPPLLRSSTRRREDEAMWLRRAAQLPLPLHCPALYCCPLTSSPHPIPISSPQSHALPHSPPCADHHSTRFLPSFLGLPCDESSDEVFQLPAHPYPQPRLCLLVVDVLP